MELNDIAFRSLYLAADAPEVLFCWIKDCAEVTILRRNPYTDFKLINNAIRLLLTAGIYVRTFKEWDRLQPIAQTWVTLCTMIQEAFQQPPECNGTYRGTSWVCPSSAISAECI
jgi:hypothetical protein